MFLIFAAADIVFHLNHRLSPKLTYVLSAGLKTMFIANRYVCWVLLVFIASSSFADEKLPSFDALDYFDSKMIIENKLSEISSLIYLEDRSTMKEDERHSCIKLSYSFDKRGRELSVDLNRLGGYWKNVYKDGKIVDSEYIDKETGKVEMKFSDSYSDPMKLKKALDDVNREAAQTFSSKIDFNKIHYRYFSDPCFSIDGEYRVEHGKSTSLLPEFAKAFLVKKGPEGLRSSNILYIYYEYKKFK